MTEAAVQVKNLVKDFSVGLSGRKLRAVDGLNITVADNEIFGLLGPNGSGKSTTIKILMGLLPASAGDCRLFGKQVIWLQLARRWVTCRRPIFLPLFVCRELTAFYAGISGLVGTKKKKAVESVIERVGMTEAADRRWAHIQRNVATWFGSDGG